MDETVRCRKADDRHPGFAEEPTLSPGGRDEPEDARPRVTEAGARFVDLYEAWGKREKAAEWRAKLALAKAEEPPKP